MARYEPTARAYVLATNRRMLDLIGRFTTVVERKLDHGVVEATFTAGGPMTTSGSPA